MPMELLNTTTSFAADNGAMAILKSVVTAVPIFFSLFLFLFFLLATASSYFATLKLSGRRRFWQSLTGVSFVSFILSLVIAGMNTPEVEFLAGYWVGFYILMTLMSWYGLSQYK